MASYNVNNVFSGLNYQNYTLMNSLGGTSKTSGSSSGVFGNYGIDTSWLYNTTGKSGYGVNTTTTQADTKEYVSGIKEHSSKLLDAANKLTERFPPLFKQLTNIVDNQEVLEVNNVNANVANSSKTLDVQVKQAASAQENTGSRMSAGAKTLSEGVSSFEINKGGKSYSLSVDVKKGDTNMAAQQKVADAINKQGIGLTASVTYDKKTNESYLTVKSTETGEKQAFSIGDTSGGSLISKMGVGKAATEAKDAVYNVNGGVDFKSSGNNVTLGNGVTATLKEAGTANVSLKKDTDKVMGVIKDFVSGYNSLLQSAKKYSSTGSDKITSQLTSAFKNNSVKLANAGITADKDGNLKIDEKKAAAAIGNGSMERALGADSYSNTSFSGAVKQVSKAVNSKPNQYIGYQKADTNNNQWSSMLNNNSFGNNQFGSMTGLGLLFSGLF